MTRGRRITAARHLRLLASLEILVVQGNYSEVRRLLNAVDPLEMRELANEIEDDLPRIGASRRPVTSRRDASSLLDVWDETLRPDAEVIPLPGGYSMKAPCA